MSLRISLQTETKFKSASNKTQQREIRETCEVCQKQYTAKGSLKVHWNSQHQQTHGLFENQRSEYWSIATYKLIKCVFLLTVRVLKSLSRNGSSICEHCGSKLSSRYLFKQHYLLHQNATIFFQSKTSF